MLLDTSQAVGDGLFGAGLGHDEMIWQAVQVAGAASVIDDAIVEGSDISNPTAHMLKTMDGFGTKAIRFACMVDE